MKHTWSDGKPTYQAARQFPGRLVEFVLLPGLIGQSFVIDANGVHDVTFRDRVRAGQ